LLPGPYTWVVELPEVVAVVPSPKVHAYDSTWSAPPVAGVTFAVNVQGCPCPITAVPCVAVMLTDNGGRFPTVTAVVAATDSPVLESRPGTRIVSLPADVTGW